MTDENLDHAVEIGKKVRAARKSASLSLRDLAAEADVSASMLSQIENGKTYPSVRTLYNIASSLRLPVDHFFPTIKSSVAPRHHVTEGADIDLPMTPSELREAQLAGQTDGLFNAAEEENKVVLRVDERPSIVLSGGVVWARLTAQAEENIEFLEIVYDPGSSSGGSLSHHSGREFGVVLDGELVVELGFEKYVLRPGDSIIFDSSTPHRLSNFGKVPMRAIWVTLET